MLAAKIQDISKRALAYENMLWFPDSQDAKSAMECQLYAVRGLEEMKSAASSVIPVMQKMLEDPKTVPEVRKRLEEGIKYLQR